VKLQLCQGCKNHRCQVIVATKHFAVAPIICWSLAWNFFHV